MAQEGKYRGGKQDRAIKPTGEKNGQHNSENHSQKNKGNDGNAKGKRR